jgi:hypothetical protein
VTDNFLDPALPSLVQSEEPGEWRRDLSWSVQCKCSHGHAEHNPALKTSSPCGVGGCGCRFLRPAAVVYREHRIVVARLEKP